MPIEFLFVQSANAKQNQHNESKMPNLIYLPSFRLMLSVCALLPEDSSDRSEQENDVA